MRKIGAWEQEKINYHKHRDHEKFLAEGYEPSWDDVDRIMTYVKVEGNIKTFIQKRFANTFIPSSWFAAGYRIPWRKYSIDLTPKPILYKLIEQEERPLPEDYNKDEFAIIEVGISVV